MKKQTNFTLEAFRSWGERMHGSKDKESWERIFLRGPRLWRGLTSIYQYIEYYGTGGGLCRPLFADFLVEAGEALQEPALRSLAQRYAELGRRWSELADAALPDNVPPFAEVKRLYARRAELTLGDAADAVAVGEVWQRLEELQRSSPEAFPLNEDQCMELRAACKSGF